MPTPGITLIRDSRGRKVGYSVRGYSRLFRTLLGAGRALRRLQKGQ